MLTVACYGTWDSPITTQMVAEASRSFGDLHLGQNGEIFWIETRPTESGRCAIMQSNRDKLKECIPNDYSARTRVHEYGGGSFAVAGDRLFFVHVADQHLYVCDLRTDQIQVLANRASCRYANMVVDQKRKCLYGIREEHREEGEPVNTLVCIHFNGEEKVIASGDDFYSSPVLSPDGERLAWLSWNHPNMPWDGTRLWGAELQADGSVTQTKLLAGSDDESIFQPQWSPDGVLYFVSDRSGWWNLYRMSDLDIIAIYPMEAEFGLPQWIFGMSTYAFIDEKTIACIYRKEGCEFLGLLNSAEQSLETLHLPFTMMTGICYDRGKLYFKAGAPDRSSSIVQMDVASRTLKTIRLAQEIQVDASYLSQPESIAYPTADGKTAYALFYPPQNPKFDVSEGERPPLILCCHGGPTAHCSSSLSYGTQYWTSRGFAVMDLDYAGSTGYGRDYRNRLKGQWGIADIDDCIYGVKYLVEQGRVDPKRVIIKGGSAGGYTVLRALTVSDIFCIGTSYFGVSDLEALAKETHKFEARYLDGLVAPYPEGKDVYKERSPLYHLDKFHSSLLILQGMEDKVVLPNQAEMMFEAVKKKGKPVSYVTFENEQHGFRHAENIRRALEAEHYFYNQVLKIPCEDKLEPVVIENL